MHGVCFFNRVLYFIKKKKYNNRTSGRKLLYYKRMLKVKKNI